MPRLVPRREVSAREPGAGLTRPPNGEWVRVRMSSPLRAAVFAGCALLWLSGAVWLVVHLTLEQPTRFGPLPSPWEPLLLKVHGLVAVVGVFLLGWIMADHLTERRALGRNYRSGVLLAPPPRSSCSRATRSITPPERWTEGARARTESSAVGRLLLRPP